MLLFHYFRVFMSLTLQKEARAIDQLSINKAKDESSLYFKLQRREIPLGSIEFLLHRAL